MEILPPRVARWEAYDDRCRLLADPEADEEESWWVRPWTEEERKVFADKFLQFHKVRLLAVAVVGGAFGGGGCAAGWVWRWCWLR